jgi:N-methylhydantoinase B
VRLPPRGRNGGRDGRPGEQFAVRADGSVRPILPKAANQPMVEGETLAFQTSGGGGLGEPRERDPASVAADVAEGLVSVDAARSTYGAEETS